jgi:heme/copper-type cytochrome/quinol oxidase subunit 1
MKHLIGVAMLVVLALVVRFLLSPRPSLDLHVHATYFVISVISLRIIVFWLLMGVAAVWSVIAAYKFGRQGS